MSAALTYTNVNDLRSWYSGTILMSHDDDLPYVVRSVGFEHGDDEDYDVPDEESGDYMFELENRSGELFTANPADMYVVFPEPFFDREGLLCGTVTSRSYKRAPFGRTLPLTAMHERMTADEPAFNPEDDFPRIGWQYLLKETRTYDQLRSITKTRRPVLSCLFHTVSGFIGFYEDGVLHVLHKVHHDRIRNTLERTGGDPNVVVLATK